MARTAPHVLSIRVTTKQRTALLRRAKALGQTPPNLLRAALNFLNDQRPGMAAYAIGAGDGIADPLGQLIAFLGLPATATPADVIAAVEGMLGASGQTAAERAYCKRRGITREEFEARKCAAVRKGN